jgi:hypothetical protein
MPDAYRIQPAYLLTDVVPAETDPGVSAGKYVSV